ncbi:hypothetical protein BK004_02545 [bacterium CG10_46_32]|nr:MAG: hypothetical protein BK004_02545 [bacterium CG10_46_32]PIR56124.1 MAG: hypothetical protein COU73_02565 [Parcubacteria group bacterium CG10_big_fil_rev_8_21_14_0_10_46_32]
MPFNFLELSETYYHKTNPDLRRRRTIVAEGASDEFFLYQRLGSIHARLMQEGVENTNNNSLKLDGAILRAAYEFLHANNEQKEQARDTATTQKHQCDSGIRCLLQDGIETWEHILELKRKHDEDTAPPKDEEDPIPNTTESEELPDINKLFGQTTDNMVANLGTLLLLMEQVNNDREGHMRRTKVLAREIKTLKAQLTQSADALAQSQEEVTFLRRQQRALEEQLATVEKRKLSKLLQNTASQGTEGRKLFELAQRLEATNVKTQKRENMLAQLPSAMQDGRHIEYEDRFLDDLVGLQDREHQDVVDALKRFANHGEQYSSLKTKRWEGRSISGAPEGSFESRSNDKFRFFWKQDDNSVIHFYRTGPHTEFSSSEW